MSRSAGLAALALAAALTTACGDETPDVDDSGAIGPDVDVTEELEALQVQLVYPEDGQYEVGEDAPLQLSLANSGTQEYVLTDVRGEDFADATLSGADGAGEIPVPAGQNVYVGEEGGPSIVLEDLQVTLRSSQSIPVTLVFGDAGEVDVEAMVSGEEPDP